MITGFRNFPYPPSANALYRNVPGVGRVKSSEYKKFERACQQWCLYNSRAIEAVRSSLLSLKSNQVIHIKTTFHVEQSKVLTKSGLPKRVDSSNGIKALYDVLAKIIGIDDSLFWSGSFDRLILKDGEANSVTVLFQPENIQDKFRSTQI